MATKRIHFILAFSLITLVLGQNCAPMEAFDPLLNEIEAPPFTPPSEDPEEKEPPTEAPPEAEPPPAFNPASLIWYADMETDNLDQWYPTTDGRNCGGEQNNAGAISEVSAARSRPGGTRSAALRIQNVNGDQGTRLERGRCESENYPQGLYYGVWFFIPVHHQTPAGWWNVFQFKSKKVPGQAGLGSDPMWVLDLRDTDNNTMTLRLRDKVGEGTNYYPQENPIHFPIGEWVHVEAFYKEGSQNDGAIIVWQNGVEIYRKLGVTTRYATGDARWSVNNYTEKIVPDPSTIYIDDATITTERIGPDIILSELLKE